MINCDVSANLESPARLDVPRASTANGALAELWTCNGQPNAQWALGQAPTRPRSGPARGPAPAQCAVAGPEAGSRAVAQLASELSLPEGEIHSCLDRLVDIDLLQASRDAPGSLRPVSPRWGSNCSCAARRPTSRAVSRK
jgi:hypothetical protein